MVAVDILAGIGVEAAKGVGKNVGHADSVARRVHLAIDFNHPSPSSLASTPFTALAQPASFRSRVAADIAGLNLRSSRQLSANFSGSG